MLSQWITKGDRDERKGGWSCVLRKEVSSLMSSRGGKVKMSPKKFGAYDVGQSRPHESGPHAHHHLEQLRCRTASPPLLSDPVGSPNTAARSVQLRRRASFKGRSDGSKGWNDEANVSGTVASARRPSPSGSEADDIDQAGGVGGVGHARPGHHPPHVPRPDHVPQHHG